MRQILITGANRGLGLELTLQLLARGERVIACCRKPGLAIALNRMTGQFPGHLHVLPLDIADSKSIAALVNELPLVTQTIDVLINNAGILPSGEHLGDVERDVLLNTFNTNAAGTLLLSQALLPFLRAGNKARIANISSVLGSIGERDSFYNPSYCISKAALNMVTRLLAAALAEQNIACVALHPGWVRTDMGGAKASIEASESAAGLIAVIDQLTQKQSGLYFDYTGKPIAW